LRLFAYFEVKKPLKQLTAKTAKNAKITQRVELRAMLGHGVPHLHFALRCYNNSAHNLYHLSIFQESAMAADTTRFTIICPCCEATLAIDSQTGTLLSHEEKSRPLASFDEMVKGLDKQKQVREQIFAQELNSMKDRDRILEEKFQEAMKRAEKDKDKPYRNPLDMD